MYARDETLLFSSIAILLAALMLGSLTELASTASAAQQREQLAVRSVAHRGGVPLSGDTICASAVVAGATQTKADERG